MSVAKEHIDLALLKQFSPLDQLDYDRLLEVARKSTTLQVTKSESLAGKVPRNGIVFLLSGAVDRAAGGNQTESVRAQTERARYAIFAPGDHARVTARTDVSALCVDSPLLEFLLACSEADSLGSAIEVDEIETSLGDWVDGLMRSDVVANLSPASLQALMAAVEPVELGADETIFNQGDPPDYYYIVSRGRCVVTRREADEESLLQLAALGPGGTFGEEALITASPRNATVKTVEDSVLLRLRQDQFKKMLEQPLVKLVDQREVSALRGKGAVMLFVHLTAAYVKSEKGVTIPYSELRMRMGDLDTSRHYVVVSDNSRISAAAAFLLTQNGFQVSLQKKAATTTAPASPGTALETVAVRFERELAGVHERLNEEQRSHAAAKERITELEIELEATRAGAKAAMRVATDKRTRAEVALRTQIGQLSAALEQERNKTMVLERKHLDLVREFGDTRKEMLSRLESATRAVEAGRREILQSEESIRELERRISEKADRVHQLQRELSQLSDSKARGEEVHKSLASQIEILQTELAALQRSIAHSDAEKKTVDETNLELLDKVENLIAAHGAVEARCNTLDAALAAEREKSAAMHAAENDFQSALEKLERTNADLQERAVSAENELLAVASEKTAIEELLRDMEPKLTDLRGRIEKLDKERAQLVGQVDSQSKIRQDLEQQLADAHGKLQRSADEAQGLRAEKSTLERLLADTEPKIKILKGQLSTLDSERSKLIADADALTEKLNGLENFLEQAQGRLSEREQEATNLRSEKEQVLARATLAEQALRGLEAKHTELESRYEQAQGKMAALENARSELEEKLAVLGRESAERVQAEVKSREVLEAKLADLQASLDESQSHFGELEKTSNERVASLEKEGSEARTEIADLTKRAGEQEATISALKAEVDELGSTKRRRGAEIALLLVLLIITSADIFAGVFGVDWRTAGAELFQLIFDHF